MQYFFYKARWYVGIALLLCLGITVMKYSAWIDRTLFGSSNQPRNVSQQSPYAGNPQVVSTPLATAPADAMTQLSQANSLLDEASANASEALEGVLAWQSDVEPLRDQVVEEPTASDDRTDDDSKLFDRLAYVMRKDRASAQTLRDAATRIESLQTKIDDLMRQLSPTGLSPLDMADISQLHSMCKQAKEDWQRDFKQAVAIKHLVEKRTETPAAAAAPTTIGSKIEDADAEATVSDLERQIIHEKEQEAANRAREAELAEQLRRQEERDAELLAKATSPEVKAMLAPFLEPRTIQPSLAGTFSIRWVRTFDKKPMSLGKLMAIGILDDSVLGLKKLALVVGNRKLPEPRWSIASQPNNWSVDDEDRLKRAQQMLRDHGLVLVNAGLLSE